MGIQPHAGEPYADEWEKMDRFERLCWYWQVENQYLREIIDRTVQFEKLLHSYEYFCNELLTPIGLTLSRDRWSQAVDTPKNVTVKHIVPHWTQWEPEKMSSFLRICGQEMKEYSYDLFNAHALDEDKKTHVDPLCRSRECEGS
jgi:hypothetical protein